MRISLFVLQPYTILLGGRARASSLPSEEKFKVTDRGCGGKRAVERSCALPFVSHTKLKVVLLPLSVVWHGLLTEVSLPHFYSDVLHVTCTCVL